MDLWNQEGWGSIEVACEYKNRRPTRRPTPRPNRQPTRRPTRRPTGSGDFDDGLRAGRQEAQRIWRNLGRKLLLLEAWREFQDSVQRRIRSNGWNSSNNWRTRAFNDGATRGMTEVVREKEKCGGPYHCLRSLWPFRSVILCRPNWRRQCRDAAITQSRGQIFNEVRSACQMWQQP